MKRLDIIKVGDVPELDKAYELSPDAEYLMFMPQNCPPEYCYEIAKWLASRGLKAIVVPGPIDLYRIDHSSQPTTPATGA